MFCPVSFGTKICISVVVAAVGVAVVVVASTLGAVGVTTVGVAGGAVGAVGVAVVVAAVCCLLLDFRAGLVPRAGRRPVSAYTQVGIGYCYCYYCYIIDNLLINDMTDAIAGASSNET